MPKTSRTRSLLWLGCFIRIRDIKTLLNPLLTFGSRRLQIQGLSSGFSLSTGESKLIRRIEAISPWLGGVQAIRNWDREGFPLLFAGIFCSKGFPVLREGNSLYRQRSVSGTELGLSMMISILQALWVCLHHGRRLALLRVGRIRRTDTPTSSGKKSTVRTVMCLLAV